MQRSIEDSGYTVLLAPHGAAALAVLAQADRVPAVILLDLHMPILDGRGFRRAQRFRWVVLRLVHCSLLNAIGGRDAV
jgi:CheY-like chemotaxis protein